MYLRSNFYLKLYRSTIRLYDLQYLDFPCNCVCRAASNSIGSLRIVSTFTSMEQPPEVVKAWLEDPLNLYFWDSLQKK